jgi:hypothetical protein
VEGESTGGEEEGGESALVGGCGGCAGGGVEGWIRCECFDRDGWMDGWMGVTLIGFIGKSVFLSAL